MGDRWATLQLPYSEERVSESLMLGSLTGILPGLEVFFPILRYQDRRGEYIYSLFDGYVFVRGLEYECADYLSLSRSPYVHQVLAYSTGSGRTLVSYTPDSKVEEMRQQLRDMIPSGFDVGSLVLVTDGVYKDLKGKVIGIDGENILVEIYMPMASLTKLTTIPLMFLAEYKETDE